MVVAHYFTAFQISISEKKKDVSEERKKLSTGRKKKGQQEVKCRLDKHSAMLCNAPKWAHESTTFMAVYF